MFSKLYIERSILGACLFCNGYPQVAHILSAKNFQSSDTVKNREIFEVIVSLYPSTPIDLITVSNAFKKKFPEASPNEVSWWLLEACNEQVKVSNNLVSWALILVQIDINDKFRASLIDWKTQRENNHEHVESAALLEILQTSNEPDKVFDVIDGAMAYFEHLKMEDELEGTRELFKNISDKCRNIKRVDSINVALNYLLKVTECSNNQVKSNCEVFARAISDMITSGQTNERYKKAVELIYQ